MTEIAFVRVRLARRCHPGQVLAAGEIQPQLRVLGERLRGRSNLLHHPLTNTFAGGRKNVGQFGSSESHGTVNAHIFAQHLAGIGGHPRGQVYCDHACFAQLTIQVADDLKQESVHRSREARTQYRVDEQGCPG